MNALFRNLFRRQPNPSANVYWLDVTPTNPHEKPCTLQALEAKASVSGLFAEVTQTLTIHNPNSRVVSASVSIPMPDGAVVCGYALDIEGTMVDGVVVTKQKARVAYETEERRGADPGLVEAVRGNLYRTRVYPLPAKGERTIRLTYVTPLIYADNSTPVLELTMPDQPIAYRTVTIEVEQIGTRQPTIDGLGTIELEATQNLWTARSKEHNPKQGGSIRVALPTLPDSFALLERYGDGTVWFQASARIAPTHTDAEATTPEPSLSTAPSVDSLTILWDASGSRGGIDHQQELALIKTYCTAESIQSITLVVFAERVREVRTFTSGNELVNHLATVRYDGGTNLVELKKLQLGDGSTAIQSMACRGSSTPAAHARHHVSEGGGSCGVHHKGANASRRPPVAVANVCVLFTDGLDTLSNEPFSLPAECNTLAIVSGQQRDMEAVRQACGGLAVPLEQAPRTVEDLAHILASSNPQRLLSVQGKGIADVYDAGMLMGDRRVVLGHLETEHTTLRFDENTTVSTTLELDAHTARTANVLARAWAARRVTLLSVRATDNERELFELGKRFGMASPATSLIALESLDQWLEHEIEPPATLPQLRTQWQQAMAGRMSHTSKREQEERHLASLIRNWADIKQWWERDYSPEAHRKQQAEFLGTTPGFCRSCGVPISLGQRFCYTCGAPVGTLNPQVPPSFLAPENTPAMPTNAPMEADDAPFTSTDDTGSFAVPPLDAMPAPNMRRGPAPSFSAMAGGAPMAARMAAPAAEYSMSDTSLDGVAEAPTTDFNTANSSSPTMTVRIQPWNPNAAYLHVLDESAKKSMDAAQKAYFEQRASYATAPSFFLDCAGWFMAHDLKDVAIRVLTNLAEMRIEDAALLRVMGWRLREAGNLHDALTVLQRVQRLRPEDSQSHRDVALVLDELARAAYEQGDETSARTYAEQAAEQYRTVALTPWDRRPMAVALFAVEEYNVLRTWADAQTWKVAPELPALDQNLEGVICCNLRITLAWDADQTDVDLHVTEPSGEEAYYGHRLTFAGGRVSEDITDGYGPELYEIRRAEPGAYTIRAHYFASHQQAIFGPATCTLTIYSDWGTPQQAQQITSMRLDKQKEMQFIGTATYGSATEPNNTAKSPTPTDATSAIEPGMSMEQVVELLGEPTDRDDAPFATVLYWEQLGGKQLEVIFANDLVTRVAERMPWGDVLIRRQ